MARNARVKGRKPARMTSMDAEFCEFGAKSTWSQIKLSQSGF